MCQPSSSTEWEGCAVRKLSLVVAFALGTVVMSAQGIDLAGGYAAGGVGQALRNMNAPQVYGIHFLLFGGENHNMFYGCLTCPMSDPTSINNSYSTYGNKLSASSVLNKFNPIRNPYDTNSMCNALAINPPIVVDGNGKFYGELTLNTARPSRTRAPYLQGWLAATCQSR
jgi:hypothetical protein